MVMQVITQGDPTRVFSGRMMAHGRWHRIEIDSAEGVQIPTQGGTAFGLGSFVRIRNDNDTKQLLVMVDATGLPRGSQTQLDAVRAWIPKRAVALAAAVFGQKQRIPESGIIPVSAHDYTTDPQRSDARAFRRRCRFDVLTVITSCVDANPPVAICEYSKLESAETHTRIYGRNDYFDAIQFWESRGYVTLLNRAGNLQITQTLDDDMAAELSRYSWEETETVAATDLPIRPSATAPAQEYDVFLSHASEDKKAVVAPLTNELIKRELRVWVDYRELRLGDRLRERIDDGLSRSRFGVVIVSPWFFAKKWTQSELDGLVALEMADGKKRILPVWHDIDEEAVAKHSPLLATRLAVKWAEGLTRVADEIVRAVRD